MRHIGSFKHYELAMSAGEAPMPLFRASCEDVYLAVDRRHRQLVEVHLVAETAPEFQIYLPEGSEQGGDPVLDSGEAQGTAFYVTAFRDGELLEHYISRRGALIAPTAFSLVLHLLDELLELEKVRGNLQGVSLERVLVCLEDDSLLRLRILDYGHCRSSGGNPPDEMARQVREVSLVLSRLLTGPLRAGIHPDRVAVLNTLPGRLRNSLRACLGVPGEVPATLEALRAQVQESFLAQSRDLHGKDTRRHVVALESMVPHSSLRDLLFPNPPNMEVLARRYQLEDVGGERHPFSLPVTETPSGRKLTVQLLPPPGVMTVLNPSCLAPQLGDLQTDAHPNIMRCAGAWEGGSLAFLLEERAHDLPLLNVLRERGCLKPVEVRLVLAQVKQAIEQSLSVGLHGLDLRPGNLVLRVTARVSDREVEKLAHRHLDAWPSFLVLARPHATLRCLMEPPLERQPSDAGEEADSTREFAALAVALFDGARSISNQPIKERDAWSVELKELVCGLQKALTGAATLPTPAEIVSRVESLVPLPAFAEGDDDFSGDPHGAMHRTDPRAALRERLRGQHPVDEPMESMGSVSDFDEDFALPEPDPTESDEASREPGRGSGKSSFTDFGKKSFLKGLWTLVSLVGVSWW
jgi:hypothetical protein